MSVEGVLDNATTQSKGRLQEALTISLPIMASQFMTMIGGFVNSLMVSRVDEASFAAALLISSFQLALVIVVFGLLYSVSSLIGRVLGEGRQPERVGQLFTAGCAVALLVCLPTIALLYFIRPVLLALGQSAALVELCTRFFHIYLWAVPAIGLVSVCVQLLLGTLKQGIVFLYSIGNLVVSTGLGYLLIFGKLGLPALGLDGLAWATLITSWLAALAVGGFVLRHAAYQKYALLTLQLSGLKQYMGSIMRVGVPISVQMGNELFSFALTTIMVGWLGVEELNMQQVTSRYVLMLVIPAVGLSQAATVVISRHFGAGNFGEIKRSGRDYAAMGLVYAFVVLALFAVVPNIFIRVFIEDVPKNARMYHTLAIILVLVAIGQLFDVVRNIITGALRGLQDTKFPMQVSIITIWLVGAPLAYVMGFTLHWGLIGMALANIVGMALGCVILCWRWSSRLKETTAEAVSIG